MDKLYLSERNITTLLKKLDNAKDDVRCVCTIVKNDDVHPVYPQTMRRITVTAVEMQDQFFGGVSQRVQLSRATLAALLEQLKSQPCCGTEIADLRVIAVRDDQYYAAHEFGDGSATGDVSSLWAQNRGK